MRQLPRWFSALIGLLCAVALCSACSVAQDKDKQGIHTNVLPGARQPTIPGGAPPDGIAAVGAMLAGTGFPWSISFLENMGDEAQDRLVESLLKYDVVVLSPESGVSKVLQQIEARSPDTVRLVQVSGSTRAKGDSAIYPGHWLLHNGTRTTSDLPAIDGIAIVGVQDTSVFVVNDRELGSDDVMMYAIGTNGKPDFSRYEEVALIAVNHEQKWVTIRRGQYGTRPKEFLAGQTVLAAHVVPGPEDTSSWVVNIARDGPLSNEGLSGAESMARVILEEYHELAPYSHGVYVDLLPWSVPHAASSSRGPDVNNDLRADWGYIRSESVDINSWGLGSLDLSMHLRRMLGDEQGIWLNHSSSLESRGIGYANGVVFTHFDHAARDSFSAAYNRLRFLSTYPSYEPRFSGIRVTTPTQAFSRSAQADLGNAAYRLGVGASLLLDTGFGYASAEPGNPDSLGWGKSYFLDEYALGTLGRSHYLGQPLGPALRLHGSVSRDDLMQGSLRLAEGYTCGADVSVSNSSITRQEQGTSVEVVASTPSGICGVEQVALQPNSAYTLMFWARAKCADHGVYTPHTGVPLGFDVRFSHDPDIRATLLVGENWNHYSITLYTRGGADTSGVEFMLHEAGTYWFEGVELREGTADVMYRMYDGGLVIVNGSPRSVVIDMEMIAPGMKFRALPGTQDKDVNHGNPIANQISIPSRDARILVR